MARLSYVTLAAKDPAQLVQFYWEVLDLAPVQSQGFVYFEIAEIRLSIIERGKLGRFVNTDLAERPASILLSLNVKTAEEVDALLTRSKLAGGEIVRETQITSWGHFGIFADPEGHLWEVAWRENTG